MKRALFVLLTLTICWSARAEDSIVLWGNYYKERSTRVIEPTIVINKELPHEAQLEVGYLVDQVTSASGAFTPTDEPFSEYRHDVRVALRQKYLGWITPGIMARYSDEGDYDSLTLGANTELAFDRDNTILRGTFQFQYDNVRQRRTVAGEQTYIDLGELRTYFVGVSLVQVLAKNIVAGGSLELRLLRGFQENGYLAVNHPRERNRHTATAWISYHAEPVDTTGRLAYRFYFDNWHLEAHTIDLELTHTLLPPLDVFGRFRYYTQTKVYFSEPVGDYTTSDPKLLEFDSMFYEFGLKWTMTILEGTALDVFARSRIEPSYAYFDQHNRYGVAHIAQLGWFWPF